MGAGKAVDAFQFKSQYALDEDIDEILANGLALIIDRQGSFSNGRNTAEIQLSHQRALVDLLKESRSQSIGDLEDCRQDGLR